MDLNKDLLPGITGLGVFICKCVHTNRRGKRFVTFCSSKLGLLWKAEEGKGQGCARWGGGREGLDTLSKKCLLLPRVCLALVSPTTSHTTKLGQRIQCQVKFLAVANLAEEPKSYIGLRCHFLCRGRPDSHTQRVMRAMYGFVFPRKSLTNIVHDDQHVTQSQARK